jgi:predicted dehydrogenase
MNKKRYVLCGLSVRGIYHFGMPLLGMNKTGGPDFSQQAELVGILDIDAVRVEAFLGKIGRRIPYYPGDALGRMISETRPDVVLVAGPDYTHCDHIVEALDRGCDVIVEKPMVINCEQIRKVQAAEKRAGRSVKVAFNCRYTPTHKQMKRMLLEGKVGRITSVEFVYNLETWHGSSYFYRWNRERSKSGGLCIHKCCHHFDFINWLVGDVPEEVFAYGALNYYGAKGALRPHDAQGRPLPPAEEKRQCPVFRKHYVGRFDPETNDISTGWDTFNLPYTVQYSDDKRRYIYDDVIDVEDTYSAVVRYRGGASLSYSCNFCTPWSGYILGINGTEGRIEMVQRSNPDPTSQTAQDKTVNTIIYYHLFGDRQIVDVPTVAGGHGGADFVIQRDLFDRVSAESEELRLVAGSVDGANAVAIGEAVWRSIKERRPMSIPALLAGT